MTECVVDLFEPVEIKEQDGEAFAGAPGVVESSSELLVEQGPVGKAGQGVVLGLLADRGLGLLLKRDVHDHPAEATRGAVLAALDGERVADRDHFTVALHHPVFQRERVLAHGDRALPTCDYLVAVLIDDQIDPGRSELGRFVAKHRKHLGADEHQLQGLRIGLPHHGVEPAEQVEVPAAGDPFEGSNPPGEVCHSGKEHDQDDQRRVERVVQLAHDRNDGIANKKHRTSQGGSERAAGHRSGRQLHQGEYEGWPEEARRDGHCRDAGQHIGPEGVGRQPALTVHRGMEQRAYREELEAQQRDEHRSIHSEISPEEDRGEQRREHQVPRPDDAPGEHGGIGEQRGLIDAQASRCRSPARRIELGFGPAAVRDRRWLHVADARYGRTSCVVGRPPQGAASAGALTHRGRPASRRRGPGAGAVEGGRCARCQYRRGLGGA